MIAGACDAARDRLVDDLGHEDRAVLAEGDAGVGGQRLRPSDLRHVAMPAKLRPCSSMKEPVPALQASFMARRPRGPPSRRMYFASWPPISKIVSTRGSKCSAPSAWAAISLSTKTASAP